MSRVKGTPRAHVAERSGGPCVEVEFEDGIAWTYFNRPAEDNALSPELNSSMADTLRELEADDRCRVLILGGRGAMFSRGLDLREYFHRSEGLSASQLEQLRHSALAWHRHLMYFGKPTIAMIHGDCYGAAFTPVIACDIALAAEEALFGLSEINHGTIPAGCIIKALSLKLVQAHALYYIMTGDSFNGRRAAEIGLVNVTVRRRLLIERTRHIARQLLSKNLVAVNAAKLAYKHAREMHWDAVEDYLHAKAVQTKLMDLSSPAIAEQGSPLPRISVRRQVAARRRPRRISARRQVARRSRPRVPSVA